MLAKSGKGSCNVGLSAVEIRYGHRAEAAATGFEQASQPNISDKERSRLLHFVVVGGGPTGVSPWYRMFRSA
jgi:NADH dehydrogenase FAD-containing subunit